MDTIGLEVRDLTNAELDKITGGTPNLGGYSYNGEGLVVPQDGGPTWGDIFKGWAQRGRELAAGKTQF